MGEIAADLSDLSVITSDNPRTEEPMAIINQILEGTRRINGYEYKAENLQKGLGKKGYFVEPTVVVTTNPKFKTMCEEIFGPVMTIYVYDENKFEETCSRGRNTENCHLFLF